VCYGARFQADGKIKLIRFGPSVFSPSFGSCLARLRWSQLISPTAQKGAKSSV
jgi:hypothetical protein